MSTSLLQALATVHFGDLSTDAFLSATQAGRPSTAPGPLEVRSTGVERLKAALDAPEGRMIWDGPIPRSEKPGHFIVINPYATAKLTHRDPEELAVGYGLTADTIAEISGIFVEVDEALDGGRLAIEEQAKIYDQIEADTGLRFSTAVLSGDHRESAKAQLAQGETLEAGKSLHVVIACRWQGAGPDALRLRQEATDALCAIAGADPLVRDVARKQRVGGVVARLDGKVRVQTCIRADPSAVFDLQDVRDRLVAYAEQIGINVSTRLEAMQTAFQARQKAKAWLKAAEQGNAPSCVADEAAETLRDLALEIRQAGVVLPSQRKLMGIIGVPKGQVAVTTHSGATRVISTGHGAGWDAATTVLTHTSGQSGLPHALWATHRRDYRVPDVHCPQHADAHASAYLTQWSGGGGYSIHCPSCGRIDSAALLLPGQVVPEFKPAKTIQVIPNPSEIAAWHKENLEKIIRAREESEARYAALPRTKAGIKHRELLTNAHEVKDLVADEILAEDADRIEAWILTASDEDQTECPKQSLYESIGTVSGIEGGAPTLIPPHLVDLALSRYAEQGCVCQRGPTAYRPKGASIQMWKMACWARTCEICGPRGRRAERAAIAGSIEALGEGWAMALMPDPPNEKNLRRWAGEGKDRVVLTVKLSPKVELTLLGWAPGHGPEHRTKSKLDAAFPVAMWADMISCLIDEDIHPGEAKKAVGGTSWLTKQIFAIKQDLLRIKPKKTDHIQAKTFVSGASPEQVLDGVDAILAPDHSIIEITGDAREKGGWKAEYYRATTPERFGGAPDHSALQKACELAALHRKRKPKAKAKTQAANNNVDDLFFDLDMSA